MTPAIGNGFEEKPSAFYHQTIRGVEHCNSASTEETPTKPGSCSTLRVDGISMQCQTGPLCTC